MPRRPHPNVPRGKTGRPPTPIDWTVVANLCAAGASGATIAHQFGISDQMLYDRCKQENGQLFTTYRTSHIQRGDDVLRVKQFELAQRGDKTMLVWLGKQRLAQRDRFDLSGQAAAAPVPVINVVVQAPRALDDDHGV